MAKQAFNKYRFDKPEPVKYPFEKAKKEEVKVEEVKKVEKAPENKVVGGDKEKADAAGKPPERLMSARELFKKQVSEA